MSWLAYLFLRLLHAVYWLVTAVRSMRKPRLDPRPLAAKRNKLPAHLALLLVPSDDSKRSEADTDAMLDSVDRAVAWCRVAGISRLSVYDRTGALAESLPDIRERLVSQQDCAYQDSTSETEYEYPLSPPPSDDSDTQPVSPDPDAPRPVLNVTTLHLFRERKRKSVLKRRRPQHKPSNTLTLHILSRESGKPAISRTASRLLHAQLISPQNQRHIEPKDLTSILEGEHGFPPPDLMIIHHITPPKYSKIPLELHGFPPWQIRFTEMHHEEYPWTIWDYSKHYWSDSLPHVPLDEAEFRRALDGFATAEMRLGK